MRLAVMQPYIFPYLGYFHLIEAADHFVFYDDVNFIKRGWINRNQILLNGEARRFTIPLEGASQNKLITEVQTALNDHWEDAFFESLRHAYHDAPHYDEVVALIKSTIDRERESISELASRSVRNVCEFLSMEVQWDQSSQIDHNREASGQDRILSLCKALSADEYVNAINGLELYDESKFIREGVDLKFIVSDLKEYSQGKAKEFVPFLSIIDVLMWNTKEEARNLMRTYSLKEKSEIG